MKGYIIINYRKRSRLGKLERKVDGGIEGRLRKSHGNEFFKSLTSPIIIQSEARLGADSKEQAAWRPLVCLY